MPNVSRLTSEFAQNKLDLFHFAGDGEVDEGFEPYGRQLEGRLVTRVRTRRTPVAGLEGKSAQVILLRLHLLLFFMRHRAKALLATINP